jgi:hypothetical protein
MAVSLQREQNLLSELGSGTAQIEAVVVKSF